MGLMNGYFKSIRTDSSQYSCAYQAGRSSWQDNYRKTCKEILENTKENDNGKTERTN